MRFIFFFASFAVAMHFTAPRALACSYMDCDNVLFPRNGFDVPANAPAFVYYRGTSSSNHSIWLTDVTTVATVIAPMEDDAQRTTFAFTTPLSEGDRFTFETNDPCSANQDQVIRVSAAAALPGTLGTLYAGEATRNLAQIRTDQGHCSDPVQAAAVLVQVTLSEQARPWEGMLMYEVFVDGAPYFGESADPNGPKHGATYSGFGTVVLPTICAPYVDPDVSYYRTYTYDPTAALSPGEHEVFFRATVAGTDTVVETQPITVSLNCFDVYTQEEIDAAIRDAGFAEPAADTSSCSVAHAGAPATSARWFGIVALFAGATLLGVRTRSRR